LHITAFYRSPFRLTVLILCGITLIAAVSGCHHSPSPDVIATVNGKDILRSELEKIYQNNVRVNQQPASPQEADIRRLAILNQMIEDEILWQKAAKLSLTASDEEVNARLTEIKALSTQEEFDKQLQAQNLTLDDLKRELRRQLTKTKLLNKEIESKINITDTEISSFYAAHKAEFNLIEPRYGLARIIVTNNPAVQTGNLQNNKASGDAVAKKKIQDIHTHLEGGEDFGNLAMNLSEDPSTASNGGDMGFAYESQLRTEMPDIYNAVSKLKPGQITEILPLYSSAGPGRRVVGYAIYKLISRESAGQRELNDPHVQQIIRQGLRAAHAQLLRSAYFETLHNEAKVHNYFADAILK